MVRTKLSRGPMGKVMTTGYNEKTDKFTYTLKRGKTKGAILPGDIIRVPVWNKRKKRAVYKKIKV